jgi:hypothetical protein
MVLWVSNAVFFGNRSFTVLVAEEGRETMASKQPWRSLLHWMGSLHLIRLFVCMEG